MIVATDRNTTAFFDRKTDSFFPFQFVFAGYILVLFGVYLLVRYNLLGLLAVLGGLFVSFSFTGIQIDFKNQEYREYLGVFQLKRGRWAPLPDIRYVTVFADRSVQEMHMASMSSTQTSSDFKVNLIVSETARIELGVFRDKTIAMETAARLAGQLHSKLLDYTSGEPKWTDPVT